MAPVGKKRAPPIFHRNGGKAGAPGGPSRKQPWRCDAPPSRGSLQEGQGFAIWRKQKIQRDYRKLLKKERNVNPQKNVGYTENYPEHLKHLYLAEEEMLRQEQKAKHKPVVLEEETVTSENNMIQRKLKAKTSNQKAKEDYEKIKTERDKKKEEAQKRREEREKAQKLYKQKKMETYKILSKRTRKGQPNLNLQMEYLLQKIEQKA